MLSESGMKAESLLILSCVTKHLIKQPKEGRVRLAHRVKIQPIMEQALRWQQLEVASHVISVVKVQRWVSSSLPFITFRIPELEMEPPIFKVGPPCCIKHL